MDYMEDYKVQDTRKERNFSATTIPSLLHCERRLPPPDELHHTSYYAENSSAKASFLSSILHLVVFHVVPVL